MISCVTRHKVSQDIEFKKVGERGVVYNYNVNTRKAYAIISKSVFDTCMLLKPYNTTTLCATTVCLKMESTWNRTECTTKYIDIL